MACREAHVIVGGITGAVAYCIMKERQGEKSSLLEALAAAVAGGLIATIPDVLEPATDPNHRGPLHSVGALAACVAVIKKVLDSREIASWAKVWSIVGAAAYASHLVLDGVSPKSLPLLGLKHGFLET